MDYLHIDHAGLPPDIWSEIEAAAVAAASAKLTARRFLDIEGPFGLGITSIEVGKDDETEQARPDRARLVLSRAIAVPMLQRNYQLSIRRIAARIENGQPLDLAPVEDAAEAIAGTEEALIYEGRPDYGIDGLLTGERRLTLEGGDWTDVGVALNDTLRAVTRLDEAGYRGPYALVLSPALYNGLFRLYPNSDILQAEHLRRLCSRGIFKADIAGGAVIDPRVGVLILGQDLEAGYRSRDGIDYQMFLSESLALRIDEPEAVCTIAATNDFTRTV